MARTPIRAALLALCLLLPLRLALADEWREIQKAYDRAFQPLPVDKMFSDLMKELRRSRQDPFSDKARDALRKERAALKLKRERIREARREREKVVGLLRSSDDPRAGRALIEAYDRVLADIDVALTVLDKHMKAVAIRINPGVDPGGVYWDRWLTGDSMPGARGVLADEKKVRDLILEALRSVKTPAVREWLVDNAGRDRSVEVRARTVRLLAESKDPLDLVALEELLVGEHSVWGRTMIVGAIGAARTPGAGPLVLRTLGDKAWSVRAAAIAAVRGLGLGDADAVDALIEALEKEDGRLRLELRNALCATTHMAFGLDPAAWRGWWEEQRAEWTPRGTATSVPDIDPEEVGEFFGIPTASKRIVFLVGRAQAMSAVVKRRELGNDGKPSPEPKVDTALAIAAWEISEALATLPRDAEFNVIVFGSEVHVWSKKMRRASKTERESAVKFVSKFTPDGG
ncbi:MAG: HEAT repeat domain-containing protein, partial [Planctomycetota bacterium]